MAQLNELKRMQQLAGLITESQLDEAEDAGTFMNTIFTTAKALGLVQMNMKDRDTDVKTFTANFQKEGFPSNSHGILGIEKISNGMGANIVIMADDKTKVDKLLDVVEKSKGNFKPKINTAATYKIQNAAKDKEAFINKFDIDLTAAGASPSTPAAQPQQESIEQAVNEAIAKTYKVIKTAKEGNSHLMDGRWKVGDMLALQQEGNDYKLSTKDDIEQTYDGQSLESLIRDKFIEPVNINEVAGLEQYKTGMKLQLKGKPDQTFTIQMVQPSTVKGMEASMALHLKDDKTGKEFQDSPGRYEIVKTTESIEQAVNEALRAYRKKK